MATSITLILLVLLVLSVVYSLVYAHLTRARPRCNGVIAVVQDGPDRGTLCVISLDGPAHVLHIVGDTEHLIPLRPEDIGLSEPEPKDPTP